MTGHATDLSRLQNIDADSWMFENYRSAENDKHRDELRQQKALSQLQFVRISEWTTNASAPCVSLLRLGSLLFSALLYVLNYDPTSPVDQFAETTTLWQNICGHGPHKVGEYITEILQELVVQKYPLREMVPFRDVQEWEIPYEFCNLFN